MIVHAGPPWREAGQDFIRDIVQFREVVKDAAGEVVELRCTYDPATRGGNAPPISQLGR